MCEICRCSPCLVGCPNAPEPESIGVCEKCGQPIYVQERYAKIDSKLYHEDCLDEFSVDDWLQMLDTSIKEAEPYEPDYDDYD